jgi:hypothetical protein
MALGHIAFPVSTYRHPATSGPKLILDVGNTVFEPGKEDSHYKGSGSGSGDKEEKKTEGQEKKGSEESKS